ncbi:MAG: hypothetical protein JST16_04395 [Bdellovibrionales bacterium]|nr:hypothetical protein [Bdellovibrionales bacterium]
MGRYIGRSLACLLGVIFLVNLLCMPKQIYPGDPIAMREESRALILTGWLAAPDELAKNFGEPGQFFAYNENDHHYYSKYGVMSSLLFAIPMSLEKLVTGELPAGNSPTRVVYLNFFNLSLSLVVAALLYALARRYTTQEWVRWTFVLLSFYATYLWNYLRAQNSEIFQLTFFLAFVHSFLRLKDRLQANDRVSKSVELLPWIFILCLALTKVSYVVMAPLCALGLWYLTSFQRAFRLSLVGAVALVSVVALVNYLKFGSPLLTGYHQWRPEIHKLNGDLSESLYGFLFSAHFSVLIHYPLTLLALVSYPAFARRHRFEALAIIAVSAVYLVLIGLLPSWRAEQCYGPRYLLFVLPVFCLPVVLFLERTVEWVRGSWPTRLGLGLVVVSLLYSSFLQTQVNRCAFLNFYAIRDPLTSGMPILTALYFVNTHYGRVNWDMSRGEEHFAGMPVWQELSKSLPPESLQAYKAHVMRAAQTSNYYWF